MDGLVNKVDEVAFRTDASLQIGTGHVIRCLTLADSLREHGAECRFICRAHEGNLIDLIAKRGYLVDVLPKASGEMPTTQADLAHSNWLGGDWATDVHQTQFALGKAKMDWLIVDHYALDHRWELAMRQACKKIMVIDDLADRRHDCDLLLDQNYGSSISRYADLTPTECSQLHGPDFALLKPVYAQRRVELDVRSGTIKRALIYFGGGADSEDLTGTALQAFAIPKLLKIDLDIVVGTAYAHRMKLEEAAADRGRVRIHSQLSDLSDLMVQADFAIGAGGATTWERCCLGLPSIVISIADNQRPACEALAAAGLIEYVGESRAVSVEQLQASLQVLISQPEELHRLSSSGMTLVDGAGTDRVVQIVSRVAA
ncbi:MAG: UDP-2,4-diacetamido-2,4,6-trideoxy-beta-L-altropyranose hydrolase [Candidatus Endobugula sp.]